MRFFKYIKYFMPVLDSIKILLIFSACDLGILNFGIPGSRPFSPIPNPGIGRVSIPGLRDYKNLSNNVLLNAK